MKRRLGLSLVAALSVLASSAGRMLAGEARQVKFSAKPTAKRTNGKTGIAFTVSGNTDVEVAILGARGKVVRHLAAGVLGGKTPPPAPLKAGLSQRLEWDGRDDYGRKASGGPFKVRVRAGMGVRVDKIAGGDPYAFWSHLSGQGDHTQWRVKGLEAKPDGTVYVMGNTTHFGAPAIRRYDAAGNHLRTVFPPPAGKPIQKMKGWSLNVRPDGSYTFRSLTAWSTPALTRTLVSSHAGRCAQLVPSPDAKKLVLMGDGCRRMTMGADSTLSAYQPQPMFPGVKVPGKGRLRGNASFALSPDGKSLYLCGLFSVKRDAGWKPIRSTDTTGFWRDGQVWKMDLATRKTSVFFALDEKSVLPDAASRRKKIGDSRYVPFAALQGVAVDAEGRVFVCDRQNKRIVVLGKSGKPIREFPVTWPDGVAVNPKSKAVYVTTRFGDYGGRGQLKLLKFNDWTRDKAPSVTLLLRKDVGKFSERSYVAVTESAGKAMVWVAYTTVSARVYRDTGAGLQLVKDFYKGGQRALDLEHMEVDGETGDVYFADGRGLCSRIRNWDDPRFEVCIDGATKKRLMASSLSVDSRNRYLYVHFHHSRGVCRYKMAGDRLVPAPVGSSGHMVTPRITCCWDFCGLGERGIAAAPCGGLAALGVVAGTGRMDNYSGPLYYFKPSSEKAPWKPLRVDALGRGPRTGGVRFDVHGNLYVGVYGRKVANVPPGYAKDRDFRGTTGRIYKYAPTGKGGDLFPTAPPKPAKIYDVHCGPFSVRYSRSPRFGVDGYGRVYYPTGIMARVSVVDNEGNAVLSFGTWGNRDDGLRSADRGVRNETTENEKPLARGSKSAIRSSRSAVYMAWPNSVDATDDYVYVSDIVNVRLLRLAKTFAAAKTCPVR
jgi:hypothetical protein